MKIQCRRLWREKEPIHGYIKKRGPALLTLQGNHVVVPNSF